MLVKLNGNFLLFSNIWKRLKESKYLVISTLVHIFVVLLFLCPHFYFKKNSKFISNSNQIPVQILVQENKSKTKKEVKKEDDLGLLPKNKTQPKKEVDTKQNMNIQETIIASQYVENIKYNILKSSEPTYPNAVKRLNLKQKIVIKTRLLVDKTGNIINIEFLESNIDKSLEKYFQKEIQQSLNSWKFSTVTVNNIPVSIYFYKDFIFING